MAKVARSARKSVSPLARVGRLIGWPGRRYPILSSVYGEFFEDSIPTVSGGITFFILLALFPALSSVVALYGLFADRSQIAQDLRLVSAFLPLEALKILGDELRRLSSAHPAETSLKFVSSFGIAVWGASGGFKSLVGGLNVAFEVSETRSFMRLSVNALIFTIAAIMFAILAINIGVVIPTTIDRVTSSPVTEWGLKIIAWPISFALTALVLGLMYRFGPNRQNPEWRWISWGSGIAAVLWLVATQLFSIYAHYFAHYDETYGPMGALIGSLVWLWLSTMIVLLGAEINSELELGEIKRERRAGKKHPIP